VDLRQAYLEKLLPAVERPAQYAGGEWNVAPSRPNAEVSFALAFPDTYAVGMSHLGFLVLYEILGGLDFVSVERVFCPWTDMLEAMRREKLPLVTLESFTPLAEFDLLGFSVQYEMCYTNLLTMLDAGGVEVLSERRRADAPIVVAGGACVTNPEPLAPFVDIFVVGDGERAVVELAEAMREAKSRSISERAAKIKFIASRTSGAYAPAFYRPVAAAAPILAVERAEADVPERIRAARVDDLDAFPGPVAPVVPLAQAVHERVMVEIMRGCTRGCRFCHAGMTKRPKRIRSPESIIRIAETAYENTGFDEVSLLSLSPADYPGIVELVKRLAARFRDRRVSVNLPSLRVGAKLEDMAGALSTVRKGGITLVPEAGTERLRRVINKNITDENLLCDVREAYKRGWDLVKLYFMIGLPTETPDDIEAIAELVRKVSRERKTVGKGPARVNVSVSTFVPKPHTPFQWEPALAPDRTLAVQVALRKSIGGRRVQWKFHNAERSLVESVLARGDRNVAAAVQRAWELGACFDAWDERFDFAVWMQAFRDVGVDPAVFSTCAFEESWNLPWDHIDVGVTKEFLLSERKKARLAQSTVDCSQDGCHECGLGCAEPA